MLREQAPGLFGPIDSDRDGGLELLLVEVHPTSHEAQISCYDAFSGHETFVHPMFLSDVWTLDRR